MRDVAESDWKLFKKMLPQWQERYMEKLIGQYVEMLNDDSEASSRFWALEERLNSFYLLGSYPLLRRKSDFAKLTQKKNAATSKKITTLSKSCSVLSRTFLFALFFDFGNLLCRCGYNPYACIAHTVKERVKLPPLRVLLRRRF